MFGETIYLDLATFSFNSNLSRKFKNFQKFPLRLSLFLRYPTSILPASIPGPFLKSYYSRGMAYSNNIGGFDGLILGNMAKTLNFISDIRAPVGSDFGYMLDNGTFIGN